MKDIIDIAIAAQETMLARRHLWSRYSESCMTCGRSAAELLETKMMDKPCEASRRPRLELLWS